MTCHACADVRQRALNALGFAREAWGVDPFWDIGVAVHCTHYTPASQAHQAELPDWYAKVTIPVLANRQALISLRADVQSVNWYVHHEVLELQLADLGDFTIDCINDAYDDREQARAHQRHRALRDEFIERLLAVHFNGYVRPSIYRLAAAAPDLPAAA